jgi:hypothetical protein
LSDHLLCLGHKFYEIRLFFGSRRVKLFRTRAGNNADDIGTLARALVHERFHTAQAVAHQDEAPVTHSRHAIDGTVQVQRGFLEGFIGCAPELR